MTPRITRLSAVPTWNQCRGDDDDDDDDVHTQRHSLSARHCWQACPWICSLNPQQPWGTCSHHDPSVFHSKVGPWLCPHCLPAPPPQPSTGWRLGPSLLSSNAEPPFPEFAKNLKTVIGTHSYEPGVPSQQVSMAMEPPQVLAQGTHAPLICT